MSLEADELVVGQTGHVYRAPVGTAFPTNISTAVSAPNWTELGYTTEDGVKFSFGRDVEEVMAWQSYDPLRVITKGVPKEVTATFLQFNQNTMATAMGGGAWTETSPGNYEYTPPDEGDIDEFAYIVEFIDGDYSYRYCFDRVQNMSGVEYTVNRSNPIELEIKVKVLAAPNGGKPYKLQTDDPNLGLSAQAGS